MDLDTTAIIEMRANIRSRRLVREIVEGIPNSAVLNEDDPNICLCGSGIMYGYERNMPRIMQRFINEGKPFLFVDLGYYDRHKGGRFHGYHKIISASRHPDKYIMKLHEYGFPHRAHAPKILKPKRWRNNGRHILVVGMSEKAAKSVNLRPHEWEQRTIARLKTLTDRPLVYRPKPSWPGKESIQGAQYHCGNNKHLLSVLENCHAVVTRHSNVAIDALAAGIPAFSEGGAAYPLCSHNIKHIETPYIPDDRDLFFRNLSWCQFNVAEMASGFVWKYFKDRNFFR